MQRWILQSGAEDEQAEEQEKQQQQQDDEALSWPDSVPLSTSPGSSSGGSSSSGSDTGSGSDSGRPEVGAFFRDLARRRASLRAGRCLAGRGAVMRQALSACVWRGGQV